MLPSSRDEVAEGLAADRKVSGTRPFRCGQTQRGDATGIPVRYSIKSRLQLLSVYCIELFSSDRPQLMQDFLRIIGDRSKRYSTVFVDGAAQQMPWIEPEWQEALYIMQRQKQRRFPVQSPKPSARAAVGSTI